MADVRRLVELSMVPELAKEVATQIDAAAGGGAVAWADVTGKPSTFPAKVPVDSATTAATATALATGRTIALTGGATGTSAAFNGAANASILVSLATPTTTVRGGVLSSAAIANITPEDDGTTAGTAVNAILAALRKAGIIAA